MNKEQLRAKRRTFYKKNCERLKEAAKRYRAEHRDEFNARMREWYARNKKRLRAQAAARRLADIGRIRKRERCYYAANKERAAVWRKTYYEKNKKHLVYCQIHKRYGVTEQQYKERLKQQNNRCAICTKRPTRHKTHGKRLYVDHDHKTKQVRGLLCFHCNTALGYLREDAVAARRMLRYIERYCAKPRSK